MSPAEYGRMLARQAKPLTDEQVEAAARIFASLHRETEAVAS